MKLEIKGLRKSFGGVEVLHGISFEAQSGKAIGLLGRNGAGKTTTIRVIMDVFKADEGTIYLDGERFEPKKNRIGYLPEERGMYPRKKVLDQILYFAGLRGMGAREAKVQARRWLDRLEIGAYENRKMETLSKGNQQKVQLAQTLICDPDIIILDEPFSGLDPVNSQILKDVVTELIENNKVVIFSSHQMNYVEEFCENVAILNHGDVVLQGKLREIQKEYGRNRLFLSAEDKSPEQLKRFLSEQFSELVYVEEEKKDSLILSLNREVKKKEFVKSLAEAEAADLFRIEAFGNYCPTLNDIFVKVAGDEEREEKK